MSAPLLFNRRHLQRQRERAAGNFGAHRFLHDWCEQDILDRLALVRRSFPHAALLSNRVSEDFHAQLKTRGVEKITVLDQHRDNEILGAGEHALDMVISIFDLHTINDLPGLLIQIRRALKPDGLFIAALPGGETLFELRDVLMESELQLTSGASPHVFPFADKQQMGALMQRAGFALPVVDSDILHVTYRDIFHLMSDLRGMGEGNAIAARRRAILPRGYFPLAAQIYADKYPDDGGIAASFEIISLIGWAPHSSQQQPQKRGSGAVNLSDVL